MSKTRTQAFEFSTLSKWLHWGSMVLLVIMMIAGITMVRLEDGDTQKLMVYRIHGMAGLIINPSCYLTR